MVNSMSDFNGMTKVKYGHRINCQSHNCPHTAHWLTDDGKLYCDGHKWLADAETMVAKHLNQLAQ